MDKGRDHGKHPHQPPLAPPRRVRGERDRASGASFSASLLDAIYHSLDEGSDADTTTTRRSEEKALAPAPAQFWWAGKPKQADRNRRRETGPAAAARPRHSGYASSTTSSSDSTSSYSFSCSSAWTTDTESTRRRRSSPPPPRRQPEELVAADGAEADSPALTPCDNAKKKKGRPCFPVARLRPRDAAPPSSPGPALPQSPATFACVLKTLFTSGRLPRKPKTSTRVPPSHILPELPRPSCTSVTTDAGTVERRCVRFCSDAEVSVVRRRVEELVRSLGELEEDDEGSDSSSDLFELQTLAGANGDELPVYGTTSLVTNRAIAHAAVF
uniref:Uncharacterized protein n=1 Tax=Avena sativa TaxID=4498 RepID=A0ACD5XSZ5_AVESA